MSRAGSKTRTAEHPPQLIANIALESFKRRGHQLHAARAILIAHRQARPARRPQHEQHHRLFGIDSEICTRPRSPENPARYACDSRPAQQSAACRAFENEVQFRSATCVYTSGVFTRYASASFCFPAARGKCTESSCCSRPARSSSPAPIAACRRACTRLPLRFDWVPAPSAATCATCTAVLFSRSRTRSRIDRVCCNPPAP